jgi:hypothetical protein
VSVTRSSGLLCRDYRISHGVPSVPCGAQDTAPVPRELAGNAPPREPARDGWSRRSLLKTLTLGIGAGAGVLSRSARAEEPPATFFVSALGDDNHAGISPEQAWRTLARVNRAPLRPGDRVLLRGGDLWREMLTPMVSGRAGQPITFGAYGEGGLPTISGAADLTAGPWTEHKGNRWSVRTAGESGGDAPALCFFGSARGARKDEQADVRQAGDWHWSGDGTSGTLVVYATSLPSTAYGIIELQIAHVIVDIGADHIHLEGLRLEKGRYNVRIGRSATVTGVRLIDCEGRHAARHCFQIEGKSHACTVSGGAAYENGDFEAGVGQSGHVGHGVHLTRGAHDNVVTGMALFRNTEDGVQQSRTCGDGNLVELCDIFENFEDGVDTKNGNCTYRHNRIWGNKVNGFNVHDRPHGLTLIGNDVSSVAGADALDIADGNYVISAGNIYRGGQHQSVSVGAEEGGPTSTFSRDVFLRHDDGQDQLVDLHDRAHPQFDRCTFHAKSMSGGSFDELIEIGPGAAPDLRNCILAAEHESHLLIQAKANERFPTVDYTADHNLYWNAGGGAAWISNAATGERFGRTEIEDGVRTGRDRHSIAGDPMFADPDTEDFRLLEGSAAIGAGEAGLTIGAHDVIVRRERLATSALIAASNFDAVAPNSDAEDRARRWNSSPGATALLHVRFEEPIGVPEGSQWVEALVRTRGAAHPAVFIDLMQAGVLIRRLGAFQVAEAGAPITARFRASELSGDQVEARLEVPRNGRVQSIPIVAGDDDAEERLDSGEVTLSSSRLNLGTHFQSGRRLIGLRFRGVAIPHGATVLWAQLVFKPDDTAYETCTLTIEGEATADAGPFTTEPFALSRRETTSATVSWLPEPWVFVDREMPESASPNLAPIIQAIVGQREWSAGHALALYLRGVGLRKARSFDDAVAGAPRLVVAWEHPTDAGIGVTVDALRWHALVR